MMQKRLLSVQDISCFGKCANTVALPVVSAGGVECAVLPTALLSTHTGGFTGYTFLDLTAEMQKILAHFQSIGLTFDMIYTGYFGSAEQLCALKAAQSSLLAPGAITLVDPVLGDAGRLYSMYDDRFVTAMREYCRGADIITPNVTEACLLTGLPYEGDGYDADRISALFCALEKLDIGAAVITGVRFGAGTDADEIGVAVKDFRTGKMSTLASPHIDAPLHGTGDVFASALAVYLLNGFPLKEALTRTIAFVSSAIRDTGEDIERHWYGVRFEDSLSMIAEDCRRQRLETALLAADKTKPEENA